MERPPEMQAPVEVSRHGKRPNTDFDKFFLSSAFTFTCVTSMFNRGSTHFTTAKSNALY